MLLIKNSQERFFISVIKNFSLSHSAFFFLNFNFDFYKLDVEIFNFHQSFANKFYILN